MDKEPRIDPDKYSQLIFDKGARETQQGKDSLFNTGAGTTELPKKLIDTVLTSFRKFTQNIGSFPHFIALNVKCKTINS